MHGGLTIGFYKMIHFCINVGYIYTFKINVHYVGCVHGGLTIGFYKMIHFCINVGYIYTFKINVHYVGCVCGGGGHRPYTISSICSCIRVRASVLSNTSSVWRPCLGKTSALYFCLIIIYCNDNLTHNTR